MPVLYDFLGSNMGKNPWWRASSHARLGILSYRRLIRSKRRLISWAVRQSFRLVQRSFNDTYKAIGMAAAASSEQMSAFDCSVPRTSIASGSVSCG
jgi:hypothetical protein